MFQLDQSQWLPADLVAGRQHDQLVQTAGHAFRHSAQFRRRMQDAGVAPEALSTQQGLRCLPVMDRQDVQSAGEGLFCMQIPRAHAPVSESSTSGSSGRPVRVRRTAVNRIMWLAMTLREHLWQRRDFLGTLAVIRDDYLESEQMQLPDWGAPASLLFDTGTSHALGVRAGIGHQFEWLRAIDPEYLLVYPTNLAALLIEFEQRGLNLPHLRQIRTINETLSDSVRESARRVLGVDIADTYSSAEVGVIAVQCPASGLYHVMAESLIVEILNDHDVPCAPGEVGRVVVTDLHNLATPLIRYEIGDYAEASPSCPCGRGLPAIRRIAGRRRNMARLPDGRAVWPPVGGLRYAEIAPIRQFQFVQYGIDAIEVRLVTDVPLSEEQERRLGELVQSALGYAFRFDFKYFPVEIPRGAGGKFEEFICTIT